TRSMKLPIQVTFRDIPASEPIEANIRRRAGKLDELHRGVMACRVTLEEASRRPARFHVRIDVTVPGGELVAAHEDEDVYVAIRDAFDGVRRQLSDHAQRRR